MNPKEHRLILLATLRHVYVEVQTVLAHRAISWDIEEQFPSRPCRTFAPPELHASISLLGRFEDAIPGLDCLGRREAQIVDGWSSEWDTEILVDSHCAVRQLSGGALDSAGFDCDSRRGVIILSKS